MTYGNRAVSLLVVPLLTLVVSCNDGPPEQVRLPPTLTPHDREAIRALSDDYANRVMAGDWEGWAALFHQDAVRMYPRMPDLEGRAAIRQHAEDFHAALGASIDFVKFSTVEVDGTRDLAYIRGTIRSEGTLEENEQDVKVEIAATWLAVVRRDANDAWRFYRFIHHSDLNGATMEPQVARRSSAVKAVH